MMGWWKRIWCGHEWTLSTVKVVTDDLLDMGWITWTEECVRCGKTRYYWRPA